MWKRQAVCPMRCGTKTAECFLWSGLCGRDFGPRDTYALRMIGALLCQSAAGEGRVGRHRRDDAALRMGRLRAAALRVLTEERIFRNCILAGLRSAGSHCENNLILTSGSIPYLRFDFSCEEQVYHLLSPKGGAKSVRQAKTSGNGRRLAPETLRGQARARVFDGASAARSSSRVFARRKLRCAPRNYKKNVSIYRMRCAQP